jgi:hypothetical protein
MSASKTATGESSAAPDLYLQQVLARPGDYRQICGFAVASNDIPLPIYGSAMQSEFHVSTANLTALKARRAEIVPALSKHLQGIAPAKFTVPLGEIITGLDAVETLPALLQTEEQFAAQLAKLPPLPADGAFTRQNMKTWSVAIAQREVLSVMLQLLRGQRFQALLNSDFEKMYAAAVRERAAKEDLREIKTPADAAAKNMKWLRFDPIYEVPLGYLDKKVEAEMTPEVRAKVRSLAEQFLKTVPPEKWVATVEIK